jgi:hypothetical protein
MLVDEPEALLGPLLDFFGETLESNRHGRAR